MKSKIFILIAISVLFATFAPLNSAHAWECAGKIVAVDHWESSGKIFVSVERADQTVVTKPVIVNGGDFTYTKQVLAIALTALSNTSDVKVYIQNGVINGIVIE
jgi:hypothetical protein